VKYPQIAQSKTKNLIRL